MNLLELCDRCSSDLDDTSVPPLWSKNDLIRYAQYAVNKMCEECKFLVDSTTPAITEITLAKTVSIYALDPLIIEVLEVYPDWGSMPLIKTDTNDLTRLTNWRTRTGTPRGYALDYQIDKLKVFPIPEDADDGHKINLTVVRYPLISFSTTNMESQTPEIPARYHEDLINGMISKAYLKHDSETFNEKSAAIFAALFKARMDEIANKFKNKTKSAQTASPLKAFI